MDSVLSSIDYTISTNKICDSNNLGKNGWREITRKGRIVTCLEYVVFLLFELLSGKEIDLSHFSYVLLAKHII
jgi:hypothetical protein